MRHDSIPRPSTITQMTPRAIDWNREEQCGSLTHHTLCPDSPTMTLDDAAHRREADAGALVVRFHVEAMERLEQPLGVRHVETCAVVAYEECLLPIHDVLPEHDPGVGAPGRELPGIPQQVVEQDPHQP